ncbi:helix-turn-helix domain-containing protein [Burkholderia sp. L27(2015)]|uniref:helix-turn-helix domain-containing protein n=1 Tax=Burkholderia sp. L27(2015) TaxID=1641858 RepID=UPI00131BCB3C|nr:helix-turn-helix domain-containing protein [Burkholderia sp. L27(2015)]
MNSVSASAAIDLALSNYPIQEKFGDALLPGFTVVPSILLREQHSLRLNDGEMLVAMHLLLAWWEKDRLPYTKSATIAKRMGVTARTVQRHMKGLEAKGYLLKVIDPQDSDKTAFDLAPLVNRLQELGRKAHAARWKAQPAEQASELVASGLASSVS